MCLTVSGILTFYVFDLEKSRSWINGAIRYQILNTIQSVSRIFALALNVSEILAFVIFDLKKVGQDHGVQLSQWRHSMADFKIHKRLFYIIDFCRDTNCA